MFDSYYRSLPESLSLSLSRARVKSLWIFSLPWRPILSQTRMLFSENWKPSQKTRSVFCNLFLLGFFFFFLSLDLIQIWEFRNGFMGFEYFCLFVWVFCCEFFRCASIVMPRTQLGLLWLTGSSSASIARPCIVALAFTSALSGLNLNWVFSVLWIFVCFWASRSWFGVFFIWFSYELAHLFYFLLCL